MGAGGRLCKSVTALLYRLATSSAHHWLPGCLAACASMPVRPTSACLPIILQGIIGSVPYNALIFLTLYLQLMGAQLAARPHRMIVGCGARLYCCKAWRWSCLSRMLSLQAGAITDPLSPANCPCVLTMELTRSTTPAGMSNAAASACVAVYLGAGGLGGLLGGWIGDVAARRFPNHGRIVATQFSVIVGIPFTALIFKASWEVLVQANDSDWCQAKCMILCALLVHMQRRCELQRG